MLYAVAMGQIKSLSEYSVMVYGSKPPLFARHDARVNFKVVFKKECLVGLQKCRYCISGSLQEASKTLNFVASVS